MRRMLGLGLVLLVACNALFDIEAGMYVPSVADGGANEPDVASGPPDGRSADDDDAALPDAGPCENLEENPRHCGACSHDCGGGLCGKGQCLEFIVTTERGGDTLGDMVVGANDLTWVNLTRGEIRRAPKRGGGAPTLFYAAPSGATLGVDLKARDGYLYFTEQLQGVPGRVARCKQSGCTQAETVLEGLVIPGPIALTKDTLVAIDNGAPQRILRCNAVPCEKTPEVLSTGEKLPVRLDARGDVVAWTTLSGSSVLRIITGESGPRPLYSGQSLIVVELTDTDVIFSELGKSIRTLSLDGGAVANALAEARQCDNLIVDDGTLFFNDNDIGRIASIPLLPDASATTLASKQGNISSLALDAKAIYWRNGDGTLHGLAR